MPSKSLTLLPFFLCLLGVTQMTAQDVQFSQFYEADLLHNPALTGSKHKNRFILHDRLQWPGVDGRYITSFFSFDKYFYKKKIGLGSYVKYDQQGRNILTNFNWQLMASYELNLSKEWALRMGIDAGIYQKKLDDSNLIYPEQVSSQGIDPFFNNRIGQLKYSNVDIGTGILLYNENFWMGMNASHLNPQVQDFINGTGIYPRRFDFITGYRIDIGKEHPTRFTGYIKDYYLFPSFHYKMQGKSDQFEIGSHLINDQFKFGLFYRGIPFKKYNSDLHNSESIIALIGWSLKLWEFTYSYDIVFSELQPARTAGAHEIHISFIFPLETKQKNYKILPCPDFQKSTRSRNIYF